MNTQPHHQLITLPHREIVPSRTQPRTHFDAGKMAELKASLAANGFTPALSHLLVRPFEYRARPAANAGNGMVFEVRADASGPWLRVRQRFGVPKATEPGAPRWAWLNSEADIEAALLELPKYEVVCGERRWRASGELIAEGKLATDEVPAVIEEMDEARALELQLIENLHREDLSPLEEAEGIARMLELRDAAGELLNTRASVAAKIGCSESHVGHQIKIARFRGTPIGDALDAGKLTAKHARFLASVPAGAARDQLTKRVLADPGPMPTRELERVISDEFVIDLRGSDFDQTDAGLVPIEFEAGHEGEGEYRLRGGECGAMTSQPRKSDATKSETVMAYTCPFVVMNGPTSPMCSNPECFRAKTSAAHALWMAGVEKACGRAVPSITALSMEEAARVFDYSGRKVGFNSGYVDLEAAPDESELKSGAASPPVWGTLIKGQGVPIFLAKDSAHKVHEIAARELAKRAAHLNGYEIFRDSAVQSRLDDEPSATAPPAPVDEEATAADVLARKAAREAAEKKEAAARRQKELALAALVAAAEGKVRAGHIILPKEFWAALASAMVDVAIDLQVFDGIRLRRGWDDRAMAGHLRAMTLGELLGLAVECLAVISDATDVWGKVFGVAAGKVGSRKAKVEKRGAGEDEFGSQEARNVAADSLGERECGKTAAEVGA